MVPASLPLATRVFLGGFVRARANALDGEAEKVRQRWIAWSVHRGPREIGRNPSCVIARMANARAACGIREMIAKRAGTPGELPAFAVTTSFALFAFVQTAVGDGILPASPPPFYFWAVHFFQTPAFEARKGLAMRGFQIQGGPSPQPSPRNYGEREERRACRGAEGEGHRQA
jgi:hypothetical protein